MTTTAYVFQLTHTNGEVETITTYDSAYVLKWVPIWDDMVREGTLTKIALLAERG